jgi:hypothetical protein
LFLNVWAPANATPGSKLPVKFWIYGGTDNAGGTSDALYNGCNIATDAIIVSTAYRLGVLGFLALDTAGIAGNMGVQDIEVALQWVQDNVESFGGDPVSLLPGHFTIRQQQRLTALMTRKKCSFSANLPAPVLQRYSVLCHKHRTKWLQS